LQETGIDIDKDLKAYSNGGCCEDIAFNVYLKTVDAGVICDHYFGGHACEQQELGIDTRKLVIIGKTREFPMRIFAARKDLSDDIVTPVIQALLELNREHSAHAEILHLAEFGRFEKASDREYDGIRTLIGIKR
jgi:ABC-type phosphate/phosphonate transport system substrate-binding protein